jgi:arsenate reductase
MAEGFLKSFDKNLDIYSAGTKAEGKVNPYAIAVMKEENIDLSQNSPKSVNLFLNDEFDFVITVCDGAKEVCPIFTGKVKNRLHIGFDDPANARGSEESILSEFRRIRDEIKRDFTQFYLEKIKPLV